MAESESDFLTFAESVEDAVKWITPQLMPLEAVPYRVGNFIPRGFAKYVCLWHPKHDAGSQGIEGNLEYLVLRELVSLIEDVSTLDTGECWFAFWNGWATLQSTLVSLSGRSFWNSSAELAASFSINRIREYVLLHGSLETLVTRLALLGTTTSPQMFWPTNRRWFVASEVDLEFTVIGADNQLALELLESPVFDTIEIQLSETLVDVHLQQGRA